MAEGACFPTDVWPVSSDGFQQFEMVEDKSKSQTKWHQVRSGPATPVCLELV